MNIILTCLTSPKVLCGIYSSLCATYLLYVVKKDAVNLALDACNVSSNDKRTKLKVFAYTVLLACSPIIIPIGVLATITFNVTDSINLLFKKKQE